MGWRIDKTKDELADLWAQAIVENIKEHWKLTHWHHLWVNFFVESFRAAPYTLGHVAAIGVVVYVVIKTLIKMDSA